MPCGFRENSRNSRQFFFGLAKQYRAIKGSGAMKILMEERKRERELRP